MSSILVLREFDDYSRILSANGFEVINCPTIETVPLEDLSELEAKLAKTDYDGIFLTSRTAAQIFREKIGEKNLGFGGKIYVLGKRSYEILLRVENLNLIFFERANTAREMLEAISPEDLKNKRFLFVRGENSLRVVPDFLKRIGAEIDEAIVYRTNSLEIGSDKIEAFSDRFGRGEIICSCFFSPSAAQSFLRQCGEIFRQSKIAVIGKTTADFFAGENVKVDFISPKATAEDFAKALIDYLKRNQAKSRSSTRADKI